MTKRRLDVELVERGLLTSRARAAECVQRGWVLVNGKIILKSSTKVGEEDVLEVTQGFAFVSRAGEKLAAALDHFKISVEGLCALDVGASTGGFTDCLLQRGARRVVALDVGHGQLDPKIAGDARVESMEGVNARELKASDFEERFGVITMDVSFISVVKVLPAVVDLAEGSCTLVVLVKPQFEAGREGVGRGGVVRDERQRQACVRKVEEFIGGMKGWKVSGVLPSPISGGDGNQEYLLCAQKFAK